MKYKNNKNDNKIYRLLGRSDCGGEISEKRAYEE